MGARQTLLEGSQGAKLCVDEPLHSVSLPLKQSMWLQYKSQHHGKDGVTLWLFNIAMENGPFIDGLPIKHGDFPWLC